MKAEKAFLNPSNPGRQLCDNLKAASPFFKNYMDGVVDESALYIIHLARLE